MKKNIEYQTWDKKKGVCHGERCQQAQGPQGDKIPASR